MDTEDREKYNRHETKICNIIKKVKGENFDTFELKMLINNSLCLVQIIKFFKFKKWPNDDLLLISKLKLLNNDLITIYEIKCKNVIKYKKFFLNMCYARDLSEKLLNRFKILLTMDALKGDQEVIKTKHTIGKSIESMFIQYDNFYKTMLKELREFANNEGREILYINNFD
jgi:hypothetical protein